MKECEKEIGKLPLPECCKHAHFSVTISVQEDGFRKGWKAALEWVLKVKKSGNKLAYYNDDILMAIEGEIKKELQE